MKNYVPKILQRVTPRSNHNLSTTRQLPVSIGPLYPVYTRRVYPKDVFQITPSVEVRSNPLKVDLMGTYRVHVETFFEPLKNLYGAFDNNHRVSRDMKLWTCTPYTAPNTPSDDYPVLDGTQCNPYGTVGNCSLSNMLFFPAKTTLQNLPWKRFQSGILNVAFPLNIEPLWAYLDIVRSFYRNEISPDLPYITNNGSLTTTVSTASEPQRSPLLADEVDQFFLNLRGDVVGSEFSTQYFQPFFNSRGGKSVGLWFMQSMSSYPNTTGIQANNQGLFCRPYARDIFSTLMAGDSYQSISVKSSNLISNGQQANVRVTDIYTAMKVENFAAAHDFSNGRFATFMKDLFGLNDAPNTDRPRLVDSQSFYIDINTIKTTSATENQPAGSSIGSILTGKSLKPFYFRSGDSSGHLVSIVSISPVFTYSEGIRLGCIKNNFDDLFNPKIDGIPPQPLPVMYFTAQTDDTRMPTNWADSTHSQALGYAPAFIDDMTDINLSFGQFSRGNILSQWVNSRRTYQRQGNFNKLSYESYINPADWNFPFADVSSQAQNLYITIHYEISAKRQKSKIIMTEF